MSTPAVKSSVFATVPVSFFGSVMGLTALALAWRVATRLYGVPAVVGEAIGWTAVGVFAALTLTYLMKLILAPGAVKQEFQHPVAGNFFGTVLISLLLLPAFLADYDLTTARVIWYGAAGLMALFAWFILRRLLGARQQFATAVPAWFIPVVGALDIPISLSALQLPWSGEISAASVAVGLFFAIPLFTIVFSRLLFEEPMAPALRPSIFILLAPFSVGFNAYVNASGTIDGFATALYALALFLFAVLVGKLIQLPQCCPFRISWWAVSFPLAATAVMTLRFAEHAPTPFTNGVAVVMLAFTSLVLAGLLVMTVFKILRGELRTLTLP